jgi:hypothetical protein
LRTLGVEQQKVRIEAEVAEVVAAEQKAITAIENKATETGPITTVQKTTGVARISLRDKLLISEDLAMRELQAEFGVAIQRQVGLGSDLEFDGMFVKEQQAYFIEVKFSPNSRKISFELLVNTMQRAQSLFAKRNWKRAHFILAVVVTDLGHKKDVEENYAEMISLSCVGRMVGKRPWSGPDGSRGSRCMSMS